MPRLLVLVEPMTRTTIPIHEPAKWADTACAVCGNAITFDPAVYLVDQEVRCRRCVDAPTDRYGCLWCGKPGEMRDTGDRYCRACWPVYVAHVSDMVEQPGPFRDLLSEVGAILDDADE